MNENQQQGQLYPVRRLRNYGAGFLVVLLLSLGIATIVYSNNIIPLYLIHLIAWILLPLGVFTSLFAMFAGNDRFFYLIYGIIMILGGFLAFTFTVIIFSTIIGVFLIVLAVIGGFAYWRRK